MNLPFFFKNLAIILGSVVVCTFAAMHELLTVIRSELVLETVWWSKLVTFVVILLMAATLFHILVFLNLRKRMALTLTPVVLILLVRNLSIIFRLQNNYQLRPLLFGVDIIDIFLVSYCLLWSGWSDRLWDKFVILLLFLTNSLLGYVYIHQIPPNDQQWVYDWDVRFLFLQIAVNCIGIILFRYPKEAGREKSQNKRPPSDKNRNPKLNSPGLVPGQKSELKQKKPPYWFKRTQVRQPVAPPLTPNMATSSVPAPVSAEPTSPLPPPSQ